MSFNLRRYAAIVSLALSSCMPMPALADPYAAVGYDMRMRDKSVDVTLGWLHESGLGVEMGYENMGRQPAPHRNINQFATVNVVGFHKVNEHLTWYAKAGIHTSKWSHNGTNDYDRSKDSLIGYQAAMGVETPLYKGATLYAQYTVYEYRQVNNPNMGGFHKPSFGLRYHF